MDLPTQTHLTTLRELLLYRLNELRADVCAAEQVRREALGTGQREVADRKDEAAEAQSSEIAVAEFGRDVDEMEQVEAALHRLDQGIYGDCLDCGEPIALLRLLAQPAAERCADCQVAAERMAARAR
jgi:RNA polymerase-binding protein DksA